MQCFDLAGAKHFCAGQQPATGAGMVTMRRIAPRLTRARTIPEADPLFAELRAACLSDVDRFLFLGASQYRRGCDLLHTAGAPWALVTFYYSAFFSAKALLGMFGVWMDEGYVVTEVSVALPGAQRIRTMKRALTVVKGTHRRFWDEFYRAANGLKPWVDPADQWVLGPILGDPGYLTDTRNSVNYDPEKAVDLAATFQGTFAPTGFPQCLQGDVHLQYSAAEGLLLMAFKFAGDFALRSTALDVLAPAGSRGDKIRDLVVSPAIPALGGRTREAELLV